MYAVRQMSGRQIEAVQMESLLWCVPCVRACPDRRARSVPKDDKPQLIRTQIRERARAHPCTRVGIGRAQTIDTRECYACRLCVCICVCMQQTITMHTMRAVDCVLVDEKTKTKRKKRKSSGTAKMHSKGNLVWPDRQTHEIRRSLCSICEHTHARHSTAERT